MGCVSDAKSDPWWLDRFVVAQDRGGIYQRAVAELRAGAKVSHWMWFVFPQVAGLGMSAMSREYAISSADEARAYLAHPVLGPRLRECARIVADIEGRTAEQVFGYVDAVKLRSSMTLFAAAAGAEDGATQGGAAEDGATGKAAPGESGATVFREVLGKYFGGVPDEETLARLPRLDLRSRGQPPPEPGPGRDIAGQIRHRNPHTRPPVGVSLRPHLRTEAQWGHGRSRRRARAALAVGERGRDIAALLRPAHGSWRRRGGTAPRPGLVRQAEL
jgi:uncharacterized protein (DUF1810 family)